MLSIFNHYTINTGHNAVRLINEISLDITQKTLESIKYSLGDTEPCALFPALSPDTRFLMQEHSPEAICNAWCTIKKIFCSSF